VQTPTTPIDPGPILQTAFDYSGADFRQWCGEVGFKRFEVIHLAGPSSAAVAYK